MLIITTVVINGGTRVKCSVEQVSPSRLMEKAVVQGFPDLVSFANFINQ